MKQISIIGMGLTKEDLTTKHLDIIQQADVLIGAKRHLSYFDDYTCEKREISKDLFELITYLKRCLSDSNVDAKQSLVILASGDPLFYGIGSFLIHALDPEHVKIYPNITTVAAAFSRIKEPWQDVYTLSCHGRPNPPDWENILKTYQTIAVFTDRINTPPAIASSLIQQGYTDYTMCVFEQLGMPQERFQWYTIADAVKIHCTEPNLVVIKRITQKDRDDQQYEIQLGMPDHMFLHDAGCITKPEIRTVVISKLKLNNPKLTLWDIGSGSGSVAIESSLFLNQGRIIAVEKQKHRVQQIQKNLERFQTTSIEVINAKFPEGIDPLPNPDRVFIGGGGEGLEEIIRQTAMRLSPNGILVVNTVVIEHMHAAYQCLKQLQFNPEMIQLQINRSTSMPHGERFMAENPVWILSGVKPQ
ncbi:MAG: precorrin-6y C5,15-methyltransferase (decarboxylating) subunit CbiE [Desulfobacterales bacterium]|nr:precorrin-6y C5,15-methyltransferase (decarboxylating) subunit CbiE [Desulfobacterales bacterium]